MKVIAKPMVVCYDSLVYRFRMKCMEYDSCRIILEEAQRHDRWSDYTVQVT